MSALKHALCLWSFIVGAVFFINTPRFAEAADLRPWPKDCVDQFGIPPVTFNGTLGEEREFNQWRARLNGVCLQEWENGLAELRARGSTTSRSSKCERLQSAIELSQSDLNTSLDALRNQSRICIWWPFPSDCSLVLEERTRLSRARLARARAASRIADCPQY